MASMTTLAPPAGLRIGPEGLPPLTLGWQVLQWTFDYLLQPDGPNAGAPWRFTDEQARFVLWWYAIDERGQFVYRRGMFRRMKGHGKDPLGAALCCVEFVGPCRFRGYGRNGDPIAAVHSAPWIQIAAVSKEQTRNTMTLFPGMLSPLAQEEFGIDLGKEIIYAGRGKARIEAVTSSPRALEGGRSTFTLKNETHHWITSNEGPEMAAVIARNAAKSRDGSSRVLAISNAHNPGEGSDAECDYEAYLLRPDGFLYDSLEAGPEVVDALRQLKHDDDLEADQAEGLREVLRDGLRNCAGDSSWLDIDRLVAECEAPQTSDNMALRYYFNRLATGTDKAFDRVLWQSLGQKREAPAKGALCTFGFDGSKNRDHTALVGTEVATGYQWLAGYWEPQLRPGGDFNIPEDEVDAAVAFVFEQYNVWRMYADPFYWREWLATWAGRYNRPGHEAVVAWDTTLLKKMSVALLDYRNAMLAHELSHDGSARFAQAISNAYTREQAYLDDKGERMWTIQKERGDSPLKIDAAMAGCLSWRARLDAIASGALNQNDFHGIYLP